MSDFFANGYFVANLFYFLTLVFVLLAYFAIEDVKKKMERRPADLIQIENAVLKAADEWVQDLPGARQKLAACVNHLRAWHAAGG